MPLVNKEDNIGFNKEMSILFVQLDQESERRVVIESEDMPRLDRNRAVRIRHSKVSGRTPATIGRETVDVELNADVNQTRAAR